MRLAALVLTLGIGLTAPAPAADPDWPDEPYAIDNVEQELAEVLRDFASTLDISLRISEAVEGTVRGRLPALPPREFLNLVARIYGLVWYYDGATLYVYGIGEVSSEFIRIDGVGADNLRAALEELEIFDPDFTFRYSPGLGAVFVSGPPRHLELVQNAALLLAERRPIEAEMVDIRVFPLKHASAIDRSFSVRGKSITVPGVASILRRLVGDVRAPIIALTSALEDVATLTRALRADPGRAAADDTEEEAEEPDGQSSRRLGPEADAARRQLEEMMVTPPFGRRSQAVIEADPRLDAVVIRDAVERLPIYERLIEELDTQQRLVEIEVVIADISSDRLGTLGVESLTGALASAIRTPAGPTSRLAWVSATVRSASTTSHSVPLPMP